MAVSRSNARWIFASAFVTAGFAARSGVPLQAAVSATIPAEQSATATRLLSDLRVMRRVSNAEGAFALGEHPKRSRSLCRR